MVLLSFAFQLIFLLLRHLRRKEKLLQVQLINLWLFILWSLLKVDITGLVRVKWIPVEFFVTTAAECVNAHSIWLLVNFVLHWSNVLFYLGLVVYQWAERLFVRWHRQLGFAIPDGRKWSRWVNFLFDALGRCLATNTKQNIVWLAISRHRYGFLIGLRSLRTDPDWLHYDAILLLWMV